MFYKDKTAAKVVKEGKWDEKSCFRRVGGYDIDKTNLPKDMDYLPKGAVIALNPGNGKATLVKTAKVYEAAEKSAVSLKVAKGHNIVVGDKVNGSTVSEIVEGESFDTLTISSLGEALKINDVVSSIGNLQVLGLNYATVRLDDMPSCTPTLQAWEIEEDSLPYPINKEIKEALTVRHAFKL